MHDYMIFLSNPNFLLEFQTCETASSLAWYPQLKWGDETVILSDSIFSHFTFYSQITALGPPKLLFSFTFEIQIHPYYKIHYLLFPNSFDFQQYHHFFATTQAMISFY